MTSARPFFFSNVWQFGKKSLWSLPHAQRVAAARLGTAAMADDLNFDFEAQLNARDAVDREVTKVHARARDCQQLLCGRLCPACRRRTRARARQTSGRGLWCAFGCSAALRAL